MTTPTTRKTHFCEGDCTPPQSPHKRSRNDDDRELALLETPPQFFRWVKQLEFTNESGTPRLKNRASHYSYDDLLNKLETLTTDSVAKAKFLSLMGQKFSWDEDAILANWELMELQKDDANVVRIREVIDQLESFSPNKTSLNLEWIGQLMPPSVFHFSKYGNLTELKLYDDNVTHLPKSLRNLSNLTHLSLSSCVLNKTRNPKLQKSLCHLTSLKQLSLSSLGLGEVAKFSGAFRCLERLNLSGNKLNRLPENLIDCTSLESLVLSNNQFEELPEVITNLVSLTDLDISNNPLSDLPNFNVLTSLKCLDLSRINREFHQNGIRIPTLFHFDKYQKVTQLDLSINGLTDLPESIRILTALTKLSICGNKFVTLPRSLRHLTLLRELDLSQNDLERIPEYIGTFRLLETLNLGMNALGTSDQGSLPQALVNCVSLSALRLDLNQLSDIPDVVAQLDSLTELTIAQNELTDLPDLNALTKLKSLNLRVNSLTYLPNLDCLTNLEHLDISNNLLWVEDNEIDLTGIENLTNLTSLNLSDNEADVPPDLLRIFPNLSDRTIPENEVLVIREDEDDNASTSSDHTD